MSQTVTVTEIVDQQENVFNGPPKDRLDKTWFKTAEGQVLYLFHKPANVPTRGEVLTGTIMSDKRQQLKFTKDKATGGPGTDATGGPGIGPTGGPNSQSPAPSTPPPSRAYKADPDKMKQDFTLEKARNMSIMRQTALKGAVALIVADKVAYTGLHEAYTGLMELLSEPDWTKFQVKLTDTGDYLPTDYEMDHYEDNPPFPPEEPPTDLPGDWFNH